jgi:imidazolonepropionase-like amidohydrolase
MQSLLIRAPRLFDGMSRAVSERAYVIVRDGTIRAVGRQQELSPEPEDFERVIDLPDDTTLLPGLINMHVHMSFSSGASIMDDHQADSYETKLVRAVENLQRALHTGVTTVRDCGTLNSIAFSIRDAVERGLMSGPRVIAAGAGITTTGGHCWWCGIEADNEDELRKAVRLQAKAGADFIKVFATGGNSTPGTNSLAAQYTAAELQVVTEEARRFGRATASHALGLPGVRNSIAARVTTIEHCGFLTTNGVAYDDEMARTMAGEGIYVCPTLFTGTTRFISVDQPHITPLQRAILEYCKASFGTVAKLREHGVRLVSGNDAGVLDVSFVDFPEDVGLAVKHAGMSAVEAVQSATSVAAESLGRPDLGAVTPGKAADLLAVKGNPLIDIDALTLPVLVISRGQIVRGLSLN